MSNADVRVMNKRTGDDCAGVEVTIIFSGILRGWLKARTDADGIAEFSDAIPSDAVIYVKDRPVHDGNDSGRVHMFV
jgi:hypothetical protein